MFNLKKKEMDCFSNTILEDLKSAHSEWISKEQFFQAVTDPDLIDYAIYDMEAARLKYIYILRKIREYSKGSSYNKLFMYDDMDNLKKDISKSIS